jgi:allantoin racemase
MKNIRVVVPIVTTSFRSAEELKIFEGPGYQISVSHVESGPASIECEFDKILAVPDTVAKIIESERQGADAVVIDCMCDPGLKPGREAVKIPVLGPCETSMHLAAMLGQKFSVVTILNRLAPQYENQSKVYGVTQKLASVRSVEIPVLDLKKDLEATTKAMTEQAIVAVEQDGASVIIFGCTGMLGCAEGVRAGLLKRGLEAPVIDPVPATIRLAAALVESGLSHSKLTFPPPPVKQVLGFTQKELTDRR